MSNPSILVVDDEPLVLRALRQMIEPVCPTIGAGSFAEAEDALQGDLVAAVVDLNLGDESGWDLVAAVREKRPILPVMVLTGSHFQLLCKQAFTHSAIPYEKPIEPEHARWFARNALADRQDQDSRLHQVIREFGAAWALTEIEEKLVEGFTRGIERPYVAEDHRIAASTYKTHVNNILRKTEREYSSLGDLRNAVLQRYFAPRLR